MCYALNYSLIKKRALFRGSAQFQSIINVPTRCSSFYSNIILYEYLRCTSAVMYICLRSTSTFLWLSVLILFKSFNVGQFSVN